MIRGQYCPTPRGIELLNKITSTKWRSLETHQLHSNMCVATILPSKTEIAHLHPILAQPGYVPIELNPSPTLPDRLLNYLQTTSKQALQVMPSVKYDLDGVELNLKNIFLGIDGFTWLVEGSAKLNGQILIKPTTGMNTLKCSTASRECRLHFENSNRLKNEFMTSLKPVGFIPIGKKTLTIGSSLNDKLLMTSTSIQLISENTNSFKIEASFVPSHYEIQANFGLTLEVDLGYEFYGKASFYLDTRSNQVQQQTKYALTTEIISAGSILGTSILCIFAAPEIIFSGGVIAAAVLIAGS